MERDLPTFQFDRQIPGHPPPQQGRNLVRDQARAACCLRRSFLAGKAFS